MEWLGGWLKSVIMVIMLATFVDLLLPSQTMQRYVKTVLSLFILLTLLSPVMQLFQKDWNVDRLLSMAEVRQNGGAPAGQEGPAQLAALETITREAERLQAEDRKQAQQLMETQIASVLKSDLQKQTAFEVGQVEVKVEIDNNGKPALTRVLATLHDIEPQQAEPASREGGMKPVKPVEPIRIEAGIAIPAGKPFGEELEEPAPEWQRERERLVRNVARDWQVETKFVDIRFARSGQAM